MGDRPLPRPTDLAPAKDSLQRELAHLGSIIDTSLNAVVGMDEQGRITTWSRQAEQTFGRTRDEVLGQTVASTIVPARLREAHEQGLRRYLDTRQARVLGSVVTVAALRRDGREFPAELAISPPLGGVDGRLEFIAFIRDISERAHTERIRAMQFEVTRALIGSASLALAADPILSAIATALQWPVAILWLVDPDGIRLRQASAWHTPGPALGAIVASGAELAMAPSEGFPGQVWASGFPLSMDDFGGGQGFTRSSVVTAAGLHAAAGFPITLRGTVIGVIETMGPEAVQLDDVTLSVMMDVGHHIGQFVERIDMGTALVRAHDELRARAVELEHAHDELTVKAADLERSNTDLERLVNAAREGEKRAFHMLDGLPVGVFVLAGDGTPLYANGKAVELLGKGIDPGATVDSLAQVYRAYRADTENEYPSDQMPVVRALHGEESVVDDMEIRQGDRRRRIEVHAKPIRDAAGAIQYAIASFSDVTPLHESRLALAARAVELERSNTDLEQFARVASHDLQEPLRMVASYVQLLARRYQGKLGEDGDEYIAFALDGALRMQALIADLLAYSRAGHELEGPTLVDAGQCLDAARGNLTASIGDSGAKIEHGELPSVCANPTQLTQVFQNLIGNALKFHGDRAPHIQVEAEPVNRSWLFSVMDNGIGIEAAQRDRIFQVFQRLHGREEYPGTGIGLALCKKVVERLGGHIWVESEPGMGSTFKFTLPMADLPDR